MVEITFIDAAIDDLRKVGPEAIPKIFKKLLLLLDSPTAGHPLGGDLTGFRKLVVGANTWRIVYRVVDEKSIEICEIWAVGARADCEVYDEATKRVQKAAITQPELRKLPEIIERLGRIVGAITAPASPTRELVPDWLAHRLTYTVGIPPQEVAAMSLQEAVDRWGEFTSKPL